MFAAVILADLSSTCNSPRLNLLVIIFIIRLLSSNSAKISFSNPLLIPEKIFLFPVKISNALCLSRDVGQYLDTLNFSQFAYTCCQTLHDQKIVSEKNIRATTRVRSKICYGDEWTSFQTFNCFLCIFSDKKSLLFNKLEILKVTDLVENFKFERLCCKKLVSKKLGRNTLSRIGNEPNARNEYFSRIKWMQRC